MCEVDLEFGPESECVAVQSRGVQKFISFFNRQLSFLGKQTK